MNVMKLNNNNFISIKSKIVLEKTWESRNLKHACWTPSRNDRDLAEGHLIYAPALDPHLQEMVGLDDRVFCIYDDLISGSAKAEARMPGAQKTLGAYS